MINYQLNPVKDKVLTHDRTPNKLVRHLEAMDINEH